MHWHAVRRQAARKAMPRVCRKRGRGRHLGALFALRERRQSEGTKELQSLQRKPLALLCSRRGCAAGQVRHPGYDEMMGSACAMSSRSCGRSRRGNAGERGHARSGRRNRHAEAMAAQGGFRDFLEGLQAPDFPYVDGAPTSCCGAGDVVDTKFKVEPGNENIPRTPGTPCSKASGSASRRRRSSQTSSYGSKIADNYRVEWKLRGPDPQRCQAGRLAGPTANQIRVGPDSKPPRHSASKLQIPRGNRMNMHKNARLTPRGSTRPSRINLLRLHISGD